LSVDQYTPPRAGVDRVGYEVQYPSMRTYGRTASTDPKPSEYVEISGGRAGRDTPGCDEVVADNAIQPYTTHSTASCQNSPDSDRPYSLHPRTLQHTILVRRSLPVLPTERIRRVLCVGVASTPRWADKPRQGVSSALRAKNKYRLLRVSPSPGFPRAYDSRRPPLPPLHPENPHPKVHYLHP
jgi:hypothetical protein